MIKNKHKQKYVSCTFGSKLNYNLKIEMVRKYITKTYTTSNRLGTIIKTYVIHKTDSHEKTGIYILSCNECPNFDPFLNGSKHICHQKT